MSIPKNIERFITMEQAKALIGDSASDTIVEAIIEDIFAYIVSLCPSVCAPEFTEVSTVRAVLRGALTRKISNPTGAVAIAQAQGENSQRLEYGSTPQSTWILTKDEKQMVLDACARFTASQQEELEEKMRVAGAESSRLTKYPLYGRGEPVAMVRVERIPQLGRRTITSLPPQGLDGWLTFTPQGDY